MQSTAKTSLYEAAQAAHDSRDLGPCFLVARDMNRRQLELLLVVRRAQLRIAARRGGPVLFLEGNADGARVEEALRAIARAILA